MFLTLSLQTPVCLLHLQRIQFTLATSQVPSGYCHGQAALNQGSALSGPGTTSGHSLFFLSLQAKNGFYTLKDCFEKKTKKQQKPEILCKPQCSHLFTSWPFQESADPCRIDE